MKEVEEVFVCRRCHERDKKVTRCEIDFDHHLWAKMGNCEICGKYTMLQNCYAYGWLKIRNGMKLRG